MKNFLIILLPFLFSAFGINAQTLNENYDSVYAKTLNADDYGMKYYVLAMLKPGTNKSKDKDTLKIIFDGHMKNINRLANEGSLVLAGPMADNDNTYEGIFVFNVGTIEEAKALLETDPAISGKFLDVELYLWYGTAALMEILKIHRKIEKYSF